MDDLKKEYQFLLKQVKSRAEKVKDEREEDILRSVASHCRYVIEWLTIGHCPGLRRGIERRAGYQREHLVDPLKLQAYISNTRSGGYIQESSLTDRERDRIEFALSILTTRERECYEMIYGTGLTFQEVGELLEIQRSSVQWYVEQAQEKLWKHIHQADLLDYLV